jgi:hypothetical protein
MPELSDPVPQIVASRREVIIEDVQPLWSDLIDGRRTARETATRAQILMDTVNATHVANWGLSSLYALTFRAVPTVEELTAAHQRWRRPVLGYQADPAAWDRRYWQRMIIGFAEQYGTERATAFGGKLVASGALQDADVTAALAQDPDTG